jgi:hypothetical protein
VPFACVTTNRQFENGIEVLPDTLNRSNGRSQRSKGRGQRIVQSETILASYRRLAAPEYDGSKSRRAGRLRRSTESRRDVMVVEPRSTTVFQVGIALIPIGGVTAGIGGWVARRGWRRTEYRTRAPLERVGCIGRGDCADSRQL